MSRSKFILLLFFVSFISIQAIAVSHAAVHAHHEHESICDILLSIDKSPLASDDFDQLPVDKASTQIFFIEDEPALTSQIIRLHIRGPPQSFKNA